MTVFELNHLPATELKEALLKCCGSTAWVNKMMTVFPIEDLIDLFEDAEAQWYACTEADWREAFTHHPKIGDISSLKKKFASTAQWASGEQSGVNQATQQTLEKLAESNQLYEQKFGYIFIVCATGKTAGEMLSILNDRLPNTPEAEIKVAMAEQQKITNIRLEKLLS